MSQRIGYSRALQFASHLPFRHFRRQKASAGRRWPLLEHDVVIGLNYTQTSIHSASVS